MNLVFAVIVLYKIDLDKSLTFLSLTKSLQYSTQQLDVLIYDNSPSPCYNEEKHNLWNITYVHDPGNGGLGKAYNKGLEHAKKIKKQWLLLLDQDTSFPVNTFRTFEKHLMNDQNNLIVPLLFSNNKIISPFSHFYGYGRPPKNLNPGSYSLNKFTAVNSGIMIKTKLFEKAGGYNSLIKLDYSDISFMHKLQKVDVKMTLIDLVCQQGFFNASNHDLQSNFIKNYYSKY